MVLAILTELVNLTADGSTKLINRFKSCVRHKGKEKKCLLKQHKKSLKLYRDA